MTTRLLTEACVSWPSGLAVVTSHGAGVKRCIARGGDQDREGGRVFARTGDDLLLSSWRRTISSGHHQPRQVTREHALAAASALSAGRPRLRAARLCSGGTDAPRLLQRPRATSAAAATSTATVWHRPRTQERRSRFTPDDPKSTPNTSSPLASLTEALRH